MSGAAPVPSMTGMQPVTWILIANRSHARVVESTRGKPFVTAHDIPHAEGRLKDREIDADRPGRAYDRQGGGRHAMSAEVAPTEKVAERFAKRLAQVLEDGRTKGRYARLVLVAEPAFLGEVRAKLNPQTAKSVSAALDKDLVTVPDRELPAHLGDLV